MSNLKESKEHLSLRDKYYPIDKIADAVTKFFIEELPTINPQVIEGDVKQVKEETKVQFVFSSVAKLKIRKAFEEFYKDNPNVNWEEEAEWCYDNLESLADNNAVFSEIALRRHSKVLETMNFKLNKILLRHKENRTLKLNRNSKETERLLEFIRGEDGKKITTDVKDFVSKYSSRRLMIMIDGLYDKRPYSKENFSFEVQSYKGIDDLHLNDISLPSEYEKDVTLPDDHNEFEKMYVSLDYEKLSKEDIRFLEKFARPTTPIFFWDNNFCAYVLTNINRIFNKNYQNIEELRTDKTMTAFLDFREQYATALNKLIKYSKAKERGFISNSQTAGDFKDIYQLFEDKPFVGAATGYSIDENGYLKAIISVAVGFEIDNKYKSGEIYTNKRTSSVRSVLHEFLHALGALNGDFKENEKTRGFNEIVNEFITQEIKKKLNPKDFENVDLPFESGCGYWPGIYVMIPFLKKYRKVLFESKIFKAQETLQNFIGENNYKKLMEYGNLLSLNHFGAFTHTIIHNGQEITYYYQFLKEYKKDPSIMDLLDNYERKKIEECLEYDKFINQLVEHYEEFKIGKITDFSTQTEIKKDSDL